MIGSTISHYRITGKLGEGGMGTVYRATDTKLHRDVAIKVLPDSFANDADRLQRFQREAQVLASLNHANIATVFGIEERAIVMELVEGPTLADRIAAGAIPMDEALAIARQIGEALEAAHEKGVVHRDLKPANVKVTKDGVVKVLDFGLAKLNDAGSSGEDPASVPTVVRGQSPTLAGVIMGTAGYMAPEQARGLPVDKRADIWAFGVVLFEMITGRELYGGGETVADTLAAVITKDPDWSKLPDTTPASVKRLLRRCLERDVKKRLPDIGSARMEIDDAGVAVQPENARPAGRKFPWASVAAALFALSTVTLAVVQFRKAEPEQRVVKLSLLPPEKLRNNGAWISPDGKRVAFLAGTPGSPRQIWIRNLDTLTPQALPGTDDARSLFWSADSRSLAFQADGKLKRIDIGGGAPQNICDAAPPFVGSWGPNGDILFVRYGGAALERVPASGGTPVTVWEQEKGRIIGLQHLADGQRFLIQTSTSGKDTSDIWIASIGSKDRTHVMTMGRNYWVYASSPGSTAGHILFRRETNLMAQPLDSSSGKLTGEASAVADLNSPNSLYSVSLNGILAVANGIAVRTQLTWMNKEGRPVGTVGAPTNSLDMHLSQDGRQVVMDYGELSSGRRDLWITDLTRGVLTRFTFGSGVQFPVWSPDGSRIAYFLGRDGNPVIAAKVASGAGQEVTLVKSGGWPTDWSRDGRFLLYYTGAGKTKYDIHVLPLEGESKPVPLLTSEFDETVARFSPDGKWIAYVSNESGKAQVYVMPFTLGGNPLKEGKWQVSANGGFSPRWGRDGKALYYLEDRKLIAVPVTPGPAFQMGTAKTLFESRVMGSIYRSTFDVSPDGERFLMLQSDMEASQASTPITVILNWTGLMKR